MSTNIQTSKHVRGCICTSSDYYLLQRLLLQLATLLTTNSTWVANTNYRTATIAYLPTWFLSTTSTTEPTSEQNETQQPLLWQSIQTNYNYSFLLLHPVQPTTHRQGDNYTVDRERRSSPTADVLEENQVGRRKYDNTIIRNSEKPSRLIVMFYRYAPHRELAAAVVDYIHRHNQFQAEGCDWKVIDRNNPAVKFHPTDFVILEIRGCAEHHQHAIKHTLNKVAGIKYTGSDREVTRPPLQTTNSALPKAHRSAWSKTRKPTSIGNFVQSPSDTTLIDTLRVPSLWELGFTGSGIRVAIFDTGLSKKHKHFKNVVEQTNWTDETEDVDKIGHGSFVAGIIASTSAQCPGIAPDSMLHIYRMFTTDQVSYTSWFLDAFNHAIFKKIHVLNLSIGGPDHMDEPFVAKVNEMTAKGMIMVSAIGNDGPLFGTLNNPGDQDNVIGVGGSDYNDHVAHFSSRGMTLWELPTGYGRFKPDIITYGTDVSGTGLHGYCKKLSGTSVASPVVTGIVTLLASVLLPEARPSVLHPASMKQALLETAMRLSDLSSIFEQGAGKLNLTRAAVYLDSYSPHASAWPPAFNMSDCPYFSPYCEKGLYHGAQPLVVNFTIINGLGPTGKFVQHPRWHPLHSHYAHLLEISFSTSPQLSSWKGNVGMRVSVLKKGIHFRGVVKGTVRITIESSPTSTRSKDYKQSVVRIPFEFVIVPTPPRERRLLWDIYHSIPYPPGYFPRDALKKTTDPLDWNGDHPHTNYRSLAQHLMKSGYFIEILGSTTIPNTFLLGLGLVLVLGSPLTCIDFREYAGLIIVDPEEEFFDEEISHLQEAVNEQNLGVIVLADWYSQEIMEAIEFFDENTKNWWFPETGGSNVPALNELLAPWGIAFSNTVVEGRFLYRNRMIQMQSGVTISGFPQNGILFSARLEEQLVQSTKDNRAMIIPGPLNIFPVLGLYEVPGGGRISVYGDSTCADDKYMSNTQIKNCLVLFMDMIHFVLKDGDHGKELVKIGQVVPATIAVKANLMPARSRQSTLYLYSRVLESPRSKRSVEKCTTFSWSKATILHHDDEDVMISHQSVDRRKYSLASRIRHTRIFHSKSNYLYMLDFPFALSFMLIGTLFGFCLFVCVRRRRRLRGLSRGSTNTTTGTRIMGSAHSSSTSSLPPSSLSWTAAHHAPAPMLV
eukprot:gene684-3984_t